MKIVLGILILCLIAMANLAVGQEVYCENLTDITKINEGYNYIEGDIIIPLENLTEFVTSTDPFAPQNAVVRNIRGLWQGGVLPYVLAPELNQRALLAITNAMNNFESRTCIRFVERTTQANYVYFFPGRGCYSYIGNIRRGRQEISIGSGCEFDGIVQHEILHALGRWHEQSRPDRDTYIRINTQNILPNQVHNFERVSPDVASTQGLDYDFRSIMHYGSRSFSANGQNTISTINPVSQSLIGQRERLSPTDEQHVIRLYCSNDGPTWSEWSKFSTCPETCRDYMQNRTRTCIGNGCEGHSIEFKSCGTGPCTTTAAWGTWSSWTLCSVTCGTGYRYRTRVCQNGNDCPGLYYEIDRSCGSDPCVVASWSNWGEYGACSLSCGGGMQTRTRVCSVENACVGPTSQTLVCNTNSCPDDQQIITSSLRNLGCFQYVGDSNLFYYSNGSTFTLDTQESSAIDRAIVKCSQSALSRYRLFFAMIDGYCIQEAVTTDTGIVAFVHEISEECLNKVGSYQNGLGMDLWYIYDPNGITARVRRDTFVDGNETNIEEMDREAEACGINVGGGELGNGTGKLSLSAILAILSLLVLLFYFN